MAFFDELNKRVSGMAQSAQKTAEVARLQHQINQKQAEFDAVYHQIGQLYYSCHQRGVQPDESMDALCDRVTSMAQQIEETKKKIDQIRNVRRCEACGTVLSRDANFCNKCGAKVEPREEAEEPKPADETVQKDAAGAEEKNVYINWPEARQSGESAPEQETAGPEESRNDENGDSGNA